MVSYFELQDLKDDNTKRRAMKRKIFLFNKLKANCYNTHESVNFIEYPDFPYYRKYNDRLTNHNSGLIPDTPDTPPFTKRKKK